MQTRRIVMATVPLAGRAVEHPSLDGNSRETTPALADTPDRDKLRPSGHRRGDHALAVKAEAVGRAQRGTHIERAEALSVRRQNPRQQRLRRENRKPESGRHVLVAARRLDEVEAAVL